MTEVVSVGQVEDPQESPGSDHRIQEWITEIDRDTDVLRGKISGLKQKYARLHALAEEIRDDMSRICLDFGDFDDDLGHICDSLEAMHRRTMRFEIAITRNASLLERLGGQSG